MNKKLTELFTHVFHVVPAYKIDFQRLLTHLFAMFLLAMAGIFTSGLTFHTVFYGWIGTSLIYTGGYIQRTIKEDSTMGMKVYNEDGSPVTDPKVTYAPVLDKIEKEN